MYLLLWWGNADNREGCACVEAGVYGKFLDLLLNFVVNLKKKTKTSLVKNSENKKEFIADANIQEWGSHIH